jgi:peptidyl-prolyl cis-trans isomerase D
MLSFFRNFAKTWVAKIVLILPLIIAFGLIFNVSDFLHPKISDAVVTAGPRSIGEAEFKQDFDDYKRRTEQEQNGGEPIPIEMFIRQGVPNQMAESLANEEAYGAWLEKIGLRPSEALVLKEVKKIPLFFNQVTGQFDQNQYKTFLMQRGLTEERFREDLADQIAGAHFQQGLVSGIHAPAAYTALQAALGREKRDASWFLIDQKAAGIPGKPTDAQLQAFINEHADRLRQPEMRQMTLVLFSPRTVADQVKVDPEQVKKAYEFQKESMSQPEKRTFVQLPASDAGAAAAIAQALKSGADPAAVAKSRNIKPIYYQDRPKSAVPDAAVANAAFTLKAGEVSAPIQGAFGWAVVKVDSITPGHEVTFEEARAGIEAKLREKLAEAKADELVQKYQDLRDKGVSMADAAKQIGLTPLHYPPITKTGLGPNGQPIRTATGQPFQFPKPVLDALYSLPKGGESETPQETGSPNEYFALHVDEVIPSQLPTVDKARAPLTMYWMQEEAAKLLQSKADALLARVQKGESIAAVAGSINAKVDNRQGFARITPPQQRDAFVAMLKQDPAALVSIQAFGGQVGKPFIVDCDPVAHMENCKAIVKVDAIHPPLGVVAANDVSQLQPRADYALAQGLAQTVQSTARTRMKAKVYKDRVSAALGQTEGPAPAKGK